MAQFVGTAPLARDDTVDEVFLLVIPVCKLAERRNHVSRGHDGNLNIALLPIPQVEMLLDHLPIRLAQGVLVCGAEVLLDRHAKDVLHILIDVHTHKFHVDHR